MWWNHNLEASNTQHGHELSSTSKLDYNEVWGRTADTNSTVYVGGCADANEDLIRSIFSPFGHVQEIRIFKEKGYAFVRWVYYLLIQKNRL